MKLIRTLFFLSGAILLVWCGAKVYDRLTDGFSIHQMSSRLPPSPQYELGIDDEKKEEVASILNQSFRYLGKGCQFYVFESADRQTVIKFFKHKHLRPLTWLRSIPLPQKWSIWREKKIASRAERVHNLFSSCKIAFDRLPEETALLFIHLNRTPFLGKKITLIDKMGFKHQVEIDDYEFLLQKRAIPLKEYLSRSNEEESRRVVQKIVDLVQSRCQKGVADRDRAFVQNIAILPEGKVIFTDVGQFYDCPAIASEEEQQNEIRLRLSKLHEWTQTYHAALLPLLPAF